MYKPFILFFILLLTAKLSAAQDFEYGSVSTDELDMKKYVRDTSAHAVVLQEFGKARIDITSSEHIAVIYEYHVRIKIFDAAGFDHGKVEIPIYNSKDNNSYEEVSDISGVTFYTDDKGSAQKIELEDKKIYPVKDSPHHGHYSFALPGLRKGCIIEYKYRLESPFWENFPSWQLQSDIPKIYSEYNVHIPAFWTYNASIKGFLKLTKNSSEIEHKCFSVGSASCDCSFIKYGMSDIPAFITEDYMTSPKNFKSSINFELVEFTNPYNGSKTVMTKEWKDIDYQLKDWSEFGGQLRKKNVFKDRIVPVTAGITDDLAKAKAIYAWIQKSFKWNNYYGYQSSDGMAKALAAHGGSVGDINLSLITALNAAGLNTEAVLLSTRDNGAVNTLYPVLTDFDYVIAKVNIGDQKYLLDATEPLLAFGMLPFRCLNDKGRVFSLDKPSYWIDLNLPQREKNNFLLDFTLKEDGKLKGTITHYSVGYEAYKKRVAIKKFNSTDEYVEDLSSRLPKLKILKSQISNLDSLDLPLGEVYDVEINLYNKLGESRLAFNPFFLNRIDTNPFKLNERTFPVDWGMPSEDTFLLKLQLPPQYKLEAPPQLMSVALPNKGGRFLTGFDTEGNSFTFSHLVQFNKSIYSSEEYPYLKELYNNIINSEKAELVFKKAQ